MIYENHFDKDYLELEQKKKELLVKCFELFVKPDRKITLEDIYKVNGSVSYSDLYELLKAIIDNDKVKIIEFVDNIDKNGKDILIGFNPKFFIDALRVIDEEEVTLYMVNPKAPCFIKDDEGKFIYLILPVNFSNIN